MNENSLHEMLREAGERIPVGSAPIQAIAAGAAKSRRRRALGGIGGVSAAAAALIAGYVLIATPGRPVDRTPSVPAVQSPAASAMETRVAGLGTVAIKVPNSWGRNTIQCRIPVRDTVIIDLGATPLCRVRRPAGVESVTITKGPAPFGFHRDRARVIDGLPAQQQNTTCSRPGSELLCRAIVYVPSNGVSFVVESSTDASHVEQLLATLHAMPGWVGVPGYQLISLQKQGGARAAYLQRLQEVGLVAKVHAVGVRGLRPGTVLAALPTPGTMVRAGATIDVSVAVAPGTVGAEKSPPRLMTRSAEDKFPGLYALTFGTLVVTADNCIALKADGSDRPGAVVWGYGWSAGWNLGKAVVYDPSGTVFAEEGDPVGLGGGGVSRFDSAAAARYADQPCGSDEMFFANDRP